MAFAFPPADEWRPLSRGAFLAWLAFYGLFLLHIATDDDGFPFTHLVNLVIHEAGHPIFHAFGYTMGILGGTLAEILVPFALAAYFYRQRHTAGVAFCLFWMFSTSSGIATYMADARTVSLPLIGSGDHDWEILFGQWGVLHLDTKIAAGVRAVGWFGMLSVVGWFSWMYRRIASLAPER